MYSWIKIYQNCRHKHIMIHEYSTRESFDTIVRSKITKYCKQQIHHQSGHAVSVLRLILGTWLPSRKQHRFSKLTIGRSFSPRETHGFSTSMGFLWDFYRISMDFMGFLWDFYMLVYLHRVPSPRFQWTQLWSHQFPGPLLPLLLFHPWRRHPGGAAETWSTRGVPINGGTPIAGFRMENPIKNGWFEGAPIVGTPHHGKNDVWMVFRCHPTRMTAGPQCSWIYKINIH